jgi:mono/diheme cytochrome c family protein
LNAFREHGNKGAGQNVGRGNSAQMSGVAAKLNDREIKAVADYVAGLR